MGPSPREAVQRWRLVLARDALPASEGQREQLAAWEAALTASGLPVAGLDTERPKPRFAPAAPLAAVVVGEAELLDIWLVERLPRWRVREALESVLPASHRLRDVYDVWLGEAALPGRVAASVYRIEVAPADVPSLAAAASTLLAAATLPRERPKGEGTVAYDLRPFLAGVAVAPSPGGAVVRMTLRHDPERGIGRPEEVLAALAEAAGTVLGPTRVVRESLVLATPAAQAERKPVGRAPAGAGGARGGRRDPKRPGRP